MKRKKKEISPMTDDKVRVIKIGKEAIYEYIREKIMDDLEVFFDVDPLKTTVHFEMDFERGQLIVGAYNDEDENGKVLHLPKKIDFERLLMSMPDTTETMYESGRYKEYTKKELVELSAK